MVAMGKFWGQVRALMRMPTLAPSKAIRWLAVLAVAFQCIVVQSHVHGATGPAWRNQAAAAQPATDAIATRDQVPNRVPKDDDPANCFICQQMALAGAALLPVSPAPILVAQDLITTRNLDPAVVCDRERKGDGLGVDGHPLNLPRGSSDGR